MAVDIPTTGHAIPATVAMKQQDREERLITAPTHQDTRGNGARQRPSTQESYGMINLLP